MTTVIAISLDRKFEVITNGNHVYYTRATQGFKRDHYKQFAGRTLDSAIRSLLVRVSNGR